METDAGRGGCSNRVSCWQRVSSRLLSRGALRMALTSYRSPLLPTPPSFLDRLSQACDREEREAATYVRTGAASILSAPRCDALKKQEHHPPTHPSARRPARPPTYPPAHPSARRPARPPIHPPIHPSPLESTPTPAQRPVPWRLGAQRPSRPARRPAATQTERCWMEACRCSMLPCRLQQNRTHRQLVASISTGGLKRAQQTVGLPVGVHVSL